MKEKLMRHKWQLIVTSVVALVPLVIGLVLWNRLPAQVPTHFGSDGQPDGWSSRTFAVFGLPLLMLALQWFLAAMICLDPKRKNISEKMFSVSLWIVPAVSLVCCTMTYLFALGVGMDVNLIVNVLVGVVFAVLGNYLPKCKRSYTVGIRLPWTLDSDENWEHTHRFAGAVWVIGGLVMLVCAFVPAVSMPVDLAVIIALVALPSGYSFLYYLRHGKGGDDGPAAD